MIAVETEILALLNLDMNLIVHDVQFPVNPCTNARMERLYINGNFEIHIKISVCVGCVKP
jgi:hypothetical protein